MKRKLWKLSALILSGMMLFTSIDVTALAEGIVEGIEAEEELTEELTEELIEEEDCSENDFSEETEETSDVESWDDSEEVTEESEDSELVSEENSNEDSIEDVSDEEASKEISEADETEEVTGVTFSADDIAHGTSNNVTWVIDKDGKLTITGTGDWEVITYEITTNTMYTYTVEAPQWYQFKNEILSAEVNLTGATSLHYMFAYCENMKKITWSKIDTSKVTDMSGMFRGCKSLTALDLSKFNTSKVVNMSEMFYICSSLEKLDVTKFDTSNVEQMYTMFASCKRLKNIDLSKWNTSKATAMSNLFLGCESLESINLAGVNTSQNKYFNYMFMDCLSLKTLDLSGFDTRNAENMRGMFYGCNNLQKLDINSFDMSKVTGADDMFHDCNQLRTIKTPKNLSIDIDLPVITNNKWVVIGTEAPITILPKNITFSQTLFNVIDVTFSADDIAHGTSNNVTWVIDKDGKLIVTGTGDWERTYSDYIYDSETGKYGYVDLGCPWDEYRESINSAYVDLVGCTDARDMFANYANLTSIDLTNFDTSNVKHMESMFYSCSKLESIDLLKFNTSNVISMERMFRFCSSLKTLDLSKFDTSKVKSMEEMFEGCSSLETLNISSFNTSNVESMYCMFNGCKMLKSLDVTGFNTSNVYHMGQMFSFCWSLRELDLSSFNTSKVMYTQGMFWECSDLFELDLSSFDLSNCDWHFDMFKDCYFLQYLKTPYNISEGEFMDEIELYVPDYGYRWFDQKSAKEYGAIPNYNNKSITLVRRYVEGGEYVIIYDLNGGIEHENTVYSYSRGTTVKFLEPTKPGYSFLGWYDYSNNQKVTSVTNKSISVYAKWSKNTYKITYNLNGGSFAKDAVKPVSYDYFTDTIIIPIPVKAGYGFVGWFEDAAFTKTITEIPKGSTGNKTLYAKWEGFPYKIQYDANPDVLGDEVTCNVFYGDKIRLLSPDDLGFHKDGYMFTGWTATVNGKTKTFKANQDVSNLTNVENETITFTAQWKEISYTIVYNANGGKGSVKKTVVKGTNKVTLPKNTFKRTGYTADGWYDSAGRYYYDENVDVSELSTVNGAVITFYAHWVENKYKVNVYRNDGTDAVYMSKWVDYTEPFTIPIPEETREGYSFVGVNTKPDGKGKSYSISNTYSKLTDKIEEVNLYAMWVPNDSFGKMIIPISGNGTGYMKPIAFNKDVVLPKCTFKNPGKKFIGWTLATTYTERIYKPGEKILMADFADYFYRNDRIYLYAQWEDISYNVKINSNDGKKQYFIKEGIKYSDNVPLNDITHTYENHVLLGFNTKANGTGTFYKLGTDINKLTEKDKATIQLYMIWEDKTPEINIKKLAKMVEDGKLTYFTADGTACNHSNGACSKCTISNITGQKWFREDILGLPEDSKEKTDKLYTKFGKKDANARSNNAFALFATWYAISGGNVKTAVKTTMFKNPVVNTRLTNDNWSVEIKKVIKPADYVVINGQAMVICEVTDNGFEALTTTGNGKTEVKVCSYLVSEMDGAVITAYRPTK